jgi:hypothetical protein
MKKNRFTENQLLGGIVVLSLIILVVVPLIVNIINNSRKNLLKTSAYGILEAAKLFYTKNMIDSSYNLITFNYKDSIEISEISDKKLGFKGSAPKIGRVSINKKGKIAIALYDGLYCVEKNFEDVEIDISERKMKDCIK